MVTLIDERQLAELIQLGQALFELSTLTRREASDLVSLVWLRVLLSKRVRKPLRVPLELTVVLPVRTAPGGAVLKRSTDSSPLATRWLRVRMLSLVVCIPGHVA